VPDRYLVENATGGAVEVSTNPTLIRGQGRTTRVAISCAANSCSRNAPSGADEGLEIGGVGAYIVTATVSSGTFSGTGVIELWVYDYTASTWHYLVGKDKTPTNGKSACIWPVETISFRPGKYRLVARPNAVATSAAAPTMTVAVRAVTKQPNL
jgi:hypothetical protein